MALNSLPLFHCVAGRRVVVLGDGDGGAARRRLVERAGGICCGEPEAHHAGLAFIAFDDPRQAEAAAIRLRCKGLLVNVTDRPELCDFTVPSVLDRDPLLIAVGTGGVSAGLAKHLRLRLETLLPASLGRLGDALHAARERIRARWPNGAERRRALDAALAPGGALDPFDDRSAQRLDAWIAAGTAKPGDSIDEIVLGSDDPDDLTLRQARLLGAADFLLHDPAIPDAILNRARADAVRIPSPAAIGNRRGRVVILLVRDRL
ncbi:siroheme synthase [Altererythrobacter aerius]|uniref:precorrin-2 dehydrogenase n=1 Tax=Tsuneonella aeria TaxID=1837929 RepID=A0A6I4TBC6_9SPHN|nr:bifunctional precorrin-2 dehydrogenase/sirohydrochlorin ferrochelatase [Tsuneonella aeria]MXO74542.1 siroheme synthase [Tsuneonella aeria]